MKKTWILMALVCAFILGLTACDDKKSKKTKRVKSTIASVQTSVAESRKIVKQEVKEASNSLAGKQLNYMTSCIDVVFDGSNVTYSYLIDESYGRVEDLDLDTSIDQAKEAIKNNDDFKTFVGHVKNLGGVIIYTYTGSYTNVTRSFTLF